MEKTQVQGVENDLNMQQDLLDRIASEYGMVLDEEGRGHPIKRRKMGRGSKGSPIEPVGLVAGNIMAKADCIIASLMKRRKKGYV